MPRIALCRGLRKSRRRDKVKQGRLYAVLVLALTVVLLAPAAADVMTGKDIHKFFDKHDYKYTVKNENNWWVLPYKGTACGNFNVDVKYGRDYTYVMAYLFDVPKDCGRFFYWDLCRRNFELNQVKISIDGDNRLWISYEIPNRLLDTNELCSDIDTIACWYEDNYNDLKSAMSKLWEYDRQAEFRPTHTSPVDYSGIEEQAASHIRETSQGYDSPEMNSPFGSSSSNVDADQVMQEALKHIADTQPDGEFMNPNNNPPVRTSANGNMNRPQTPKIAKMQQMPAMNTAGQPNNVAKAGMSTERVAGVKQQYTKPIKGHQNNALRNWASTNNSSRPFNKVNAVLAPSREVSPNPPCSAKVGSWHASVPKTEKVAGWSNRMNNAPGTNMIDRTRSKITNIYCYEEKLIIH
jgi:hypothetical protein